MPRLTAGDVERVRAAAAGLVAEHHLPGLGVAASSAAGLVFAEAFGWADIESCEPLSAAHRHRIGSITKTMVGLCAIALVEERKLGLDDRVVERLPDVRFDGPADALRLRHLLTHTGGIGEAPTVAQLEDPQGALWSRTGDVPPVAERYADGIAIEVPPGTKWAYANHGWALVGEIVARAEGRPIEEVVQQRIFGPLGMERSDLEDRPHPDLTTGYHRPPSEDARALIERAGRAVPEESSVDGHNIRGEYLWIPGRAAGAVQCSLLDLARYAQALLRRAEGIVRPGSFDRMLRPTWCPDARLAHIGLAFFLEHFFGRASFGHNGGVTGGWNTSLKVFPQQDLALVIQLNLAYDHFDRVEQTLIGALLGAPRHRAPDLPLDGGVRAAAPGVYEATPGRLTNVRIAAGTGRIQISERDGGLVLRARRGPWKGGVRMLPADPADPGFFELETGDIQPPRLSLLRDGEGRVAELRLDRLVRLVRNDAVPPWA